MLRMIIKSKLPFLWSWVYFAPYSDQQVKVLTLNKVHNAANLKSVSLWEDVDGGHEGELGVVYFHVRHPPAEPEEVGVAQSSPNVVVHGEGVVGGEHDRVRLRVVLSRAPQHHHLRWTPCKTKEDKRSHPHHSTKATHIITDSNNRLWTS